MEFLCLLRVKGACGWVWVWGGLSRNYFDPGLILARCPFCHDVAESLCRDATVLHHECAVYAEHLELGVVDNVLLVHLLDGHVVMLVGGCGAGRWVG
jgi:hypothetical protein